MNFLMSYDDAKKLLNALYSVPYGQVRPYVEILHNMKENGGEFNLEQRLALEEMHNSTQSGNIENK